MADVDLEDGSIVSEGPAAVSAKPPGSRSACLGRLHFVTYRWNYARGWYFL